MSNPYCMQSSFADRGIPLLPWHPWFILEMKPHRPGILLPEVLAPASRVFAVATCPVPGFPPATATSELLLALQLGCATAGLQHGKKKNSSILS